MIDHKTLKKFLTIATKKLEGNWIVIGGTVLPLMGHDYRPTVDIDIINLDFKSSNENNLLLMEIAEKLNLPVESINQAGAYFLSKITDIHEHLILLKEGERCRIYRPDAYLFIKLKIERLSESDFDDCVQFIRSNPLEYEEHKKRIQVLIKKKLATSPHKEKLEALLKIN